MEISAKAKYLKISPKKVRLVLRVVRGMSVEEAQNQLKFIPKKASKYVLKLLNSALANAEHNFNLKKENLYIKRIIADEGPALKRWRPKAFGRATPIKKRSSHINIVLAEKVASQKIVKKKKIEKPITIKDGVKKTSLTKVTEDKGKETVLKGEEHKPEIFDVQREGKHRHKEHLDKIRKKEKGNFLKRVFRRKAV